MRHGHSIQRLLLSSCGLFAWAVADAADARLTRSIDSWLAPYVAADHFSGCVLVSRDDEVLYEKCFGEANRELGVRNTPATRFAIASVTKPLQLILLARLVEEEKLALTDSVARWLPDFPSANQMTVLHLANHTAGVPHRVTENEEEFVPRAAADMVELVKVKGLLHEPGGPRTYSSAGFSVLARVLELAGGDSWASLMSRYVFEPAGMEHTVHPEGGRLIPRRASSYRWSPDGMRALALKDLSFLVGAGSLYSTPADLQAAIRAITDGTYGETTPTFVVRGRERFGWNGVTNGYRTFVDHDVSTNTTSIVCSNLVTGALNRLRDALPQLIAGESVEALEVPRVQANPRPHAELVEFEGRYRLRPGSILNVRAREGMLYSNDWLMLPVDGDRFFSIQDYNYVTFVRDDSKAIQRMDWGEGDPPFAIPRVGDLE